MNTSCARFLGNSRNQLFNLLARDHHEVSQLINDHHNDWCSINRFWVFRRQAKWVGEFLALSLGIHNLFIKAG